MKLTRSGRALALLGLVVVAGCASSGTKLTQVWSNPGYRGESIQKILIIGVSEKTPMKRLFENRLSALFREKDVEAAPSFELMPPGQEITKELVRAAIDGGDYDAVLVTRLVARETETEHVAGKIYVVEHWAEPYQHSLYSHFERTHAVVHSTGYLVETEVVRLETNVYDVATETLTWAAMSETFNPESAIEMFDILGGEVLSGLAKEGLIQ